MLLFAIFRIRATGAWRYGRPVGRAVFLGYVSVPHEDRSMYASGRSLAMMRARKQWRGVVRSCDYLDARRESKRRTRYGVGASAPGGVGLL